MGLCQAFKHTNHAKNTVKNTKNSVQYTMVCRQKTLHKDSRIPFLVDEIIGMTNRYLLNLTGHPNEQVKQLHVPPRGQIKTTPAVAHRCVTIKDNNY